MHAELGFKADSFEASLARPRQVEASSSAAPQDVPAWVRAFVMEAVQAATPRPYLRWIRAAVGATVRLLDVDDVLFFHADNKYTVVAMVDAEVIIRTPLSELRRELDPAFWWTIHRATIVNVRAIDKVRRQADGRVVVLLRDRAKVLRVSESHERQFRQM